MRALPAALLLAWSVLAHAEPPGACAHYAAHAVATGRLPKPITELSGLVASHRHAGVYWAHNDSGNVFELFAIREDGTLVTRVALTGVKPSDVEDIASGPCASGSTETCLFLADTGDNWRRKARYRIYRLPEPAALDGKPRRVEALAFVYPDGSHDAEALVVEPRSGRLFVITKNLGTLGTIYRLDGVAPGRQATAVHVRTLASAALGGVTTAADIHPAGDRLLVRSYFGLVEFRKAGATTVEGIVATEPVSVTDASQPQPEAVAYTADGRGYLLGTENPGERLFRVGCAD